MLGCATGERPVHCKIRAQLGDRTNLTALRGLGGSLFEEWLRATPAPNRSHAGARWAGSHCSLASWSTGLDALTRCAGHRAEAAAAGGCPAPPDRTPL
eukprot:6582155-Prymnesium_polylepis.1